MKIRPIAETTDSVTLSRADFEALIEELEDAVDLAKLHEVEGRLAAGETEEVPFEMVLRLHHGEHPVRVWREHRGLTARALAAKAGLSAAYLSEIERGKKPGSLDATARLAKALGVQVDDLVRWRTDDEGD
jgi:DNA-binding Xre family transcriptional regulator